MTSHGQRRLIATVLKQIECTRQDLNLRPKDYESSALTD